MVANFNLVENDRVPSFACLSIYSVYIINVQQFPINQLTFFLTRPRFFSYLEVSIDVARRLADLPGLASGLIIHQEDLPVPSFWTRIKRLWSDKLCRMEFCSNNQNVNSFEILIYGGDDELDNKKKKEKSKWSGASTACGSNGWLAEEGSSPVDWWLQSRDGDQEKRRRRRRLWE